MTGACSYVLEVQFSKINSAEVHLSTRGGFAFCFFDIFSVLFVILNVNSILCESIYTAGLSGQTWQLPLPERISAALIKADKLIF